MRQDHSAPGTLEWPGTWGGDNDGPAAYDPLTATAFVAGIDLPQIVSAAPGPHRAGAADFGTTMRDAPRAIPYGTATAIDVRTGVARWHVRLPGAPLGGVAVTAGGLVLTATVEGTLYGLDAQNGAVVWRADLGANAGTAPIAYRAHGRLYVVRTTGGGGLEGAPRTDAVRAWTLG